jgi:hypothetical protein
MIGPNVCRDSLAFCTEPVWSSLANVLYGCADVRNGAQSGERSASPPVDVKLDVVEIKHGLYQVGQTGTLIHRSRVAVDRSTVVSTQ